MVELNVRERIYHLADTAIVRTMWAGDKIPSLYGWVFNLRTGLLNEVINLDSPGVDSPEAKAGLVQDQYVRYIALNKSAF